MAEKTSQKKKTAKAPSTQAHLPIAEIRDGTVVMRDGTLRSVVMVSSINFALKGEDEQNALISAYVGFLNSLDFSLQIVVQSRRLQIAPYLENLKQLEREQVNELLRVQIADYRAFVSELVDLGQIMTKRFFVVVPYDPLSNKRKSFWTSLREVFTPAVTVKMKEDRFLQRKKGLDVRVRQVMSGLSSMGLQVVELDTQSLIELYYTSYNPETGINETLGRIEEIRFE